MASSTRRPTSALGRWRSLSPYAMLPHRVFQGKSANCWKTIVTPASGLSTASPSIRTSPCVSRTNPAALRSSVVLPQPEGPMMVTISRSSKVRFTSRRTSAGP